MKPSQISSLSTTIVCVRNIPADFHSKDLRRFFSEYIETKKFLCFHYRHRPDILVSKDASECSDLKDLLRSEEISSTVYTELKTCKDFKLRPRCCILKMETIFYSDFKFKYHRKHWLNSNGRILPTCCLIFKLNITDNLSNAESTCTDNAEDNSFKELAQRLDNLFEFNPPTLMPQGNVGTPTAYFLEKVKLCQLPPSIIRKLGLSFIHNPSGRKFSSVKYRYDSQSRVKHDKLTLPNNNPTSHNETLQDLEDEDTSSLTKRQLLDLGIEEKLIEDSACRSDLGDDAEDWERHEALHDDSANIERNKERLYEEELEIVWEKGGPGIVWYTDASYWNEADGTADEKDVDDWDIDMSGYYCPGAGDRDARDFIDMQEQKMYRQGKSPKRKIPADEEESSTHQLGAFEKFSKGIGRKVMEKQGWTDGLGLGKSTDGIAEALGNDGQNPRSKQGFGYHGAARPMFSVPKKKRSTPLIATAYDDSARFSDDSDNVLRRSDHLTMKFKSKEL